MHSRVAVAADMVRTHPLRTALLSVLPLCVAALQVYHFLTATHALPNVAFGAGVLAYGAGALRLYLARHRVEMVERRAAATAGS